MKIKAYTLNAFAKAKDGGNPAGVVLSADLLSDDQMRGIAKKVGFSETAFVQKSDKADFKIRFFTPSDEVDLCGHATVASFALMFQKGIVKSGKYTQETKAGLLNLEVKQDGFIFMSQTLPQFFEKIDKDEIANSLNIPPSQISPDLPIQIVSTGLRDILIPINTLQDLNAIEPDFNKISQVSKKYNAIGYHLFTLETKYGSTAHCRNLAPLYDIPEESATGTSNGALSCYLYKYGKIITDKVGNIVIEQGYSMSRPSEIFASLKVTDNQITEVWVGGIATNIQEIEVI